MLLMKKNIVQLSKQLLNRVGSVFIVRKSFVAGELLKNKSLSIYDFDMREDIDNTEDYAEEPLVKDTRLKKILKREERLINDNDIFMKLSEFLKSMELARQTELKFNIYIDAREILTILNNASIKKALLELYENEKIELLSLDKIIMRLSEIEEKFRSYETVFDESYYNDIVILFRQIAKYLLKTGIYHIDHNIDSSMSGKRNVLMSFSITRSLIEDLKLKELNDVQFTQLVPIIIMLNNIYNLPGYLMNNLILDITARLNKTDSSILKDYLRFVIIQNSSRQSYSILNNLIDYKDLILTSESNTNDLLYLLTDNIYKFITNKDEKSEDYINSFHNFMKSYSSTTFLISKNSDINVDLLENFFSALFILSKTKFVTDSMRLTINNLLKGIFL
jgi:hypothetical protein